MGSRYILATVTAIVMFSSSFMLALDADCLEISSSSFQQVRPEVSCELKVKEKYEYYDIDGSNVRELQKQINQHGTKWNDGRTYAAVTSWDIRYGYDVLYEGGRCSVKSVKTDVDIVYHLPRKGSSQSGPELTVLWDDYLVHVKRHEFGHKDIAVRTAGEINEMLASLKSFSSQSELEKEAKRLIDEKLRQLKEDQIDYDHETRHGETQGAVLAAN